MATPTEQLNVRVPPALVSALRKRARTDKATTTAVVVAALTAYLRGTK